MDHRAAVPAAVTATSARRVFVGEATLRGSRAGLRRLAPTLLAALLACAYVLISPPSLDLAAHLFRAHLFLKEGFGLWDNMWYSGHPTLSYSVLFPAISALLTPQVAAGGAAVGTAAVFEPLARRHFGPQAWVGALLFGAVTATDLFTGRLALAFGALPALAAVDALDRRRPVVAMGCAVVAALCSPVAALFCALAAAAVALGELSAQRRWRAALPGLEVATAAGAPLVALALAFGQSGTEPFSLSSCLPMVGVAAGAWLVIGPTRTTLRSAVAVYAAAVVVLYVVPTAVGGNITRLGAALAAPLAALILWPGRRRLLVLLAAPLLYVGWQAPVNDVSAAAGSPTTTAAYYRPLLRFLEARRARLGPFRVEIPFTRLHWEALFVAQQFPIARGWERQLDIADNPIFYGGRLSGATYTAWLHQEAVRFVAVPAAAPDPSARGELALIRRGIPALHEAAHAGAWTVYAVRDPTPLAQGVAQATAIGPDTVSLLARSAGSATVHVRFTPYWALAGGHGCVAPAGSLTRLTLTSPGRVRLVIRFSLARIAATSPRCD